MNSGVNIHNAFDVVLKTYENVDKFMSYCISIAKEKGEFTSVIPKFLRWKSDNNYYGWLICSFILLFQKQSDPELENGWHDGSIYVMEVNFITEDYDEPQVCLAKFDYEDISSWTPGCSMANHYIFYDPMYYDIMEYAKVDDYDIGTVKDKIKAKNRYWGVTRIVSKNILLTEITNKNAYETIFGGFKDLEKV